MIVTTRSRGLDAHKTMFLKASISSIYKGNPPRNFSLKDRIAWKDD